MPLPSEIQTIIRATEDAGRSALLDLRTGAASGAAEAVALLETWRQRMTELNRQWGGGGMTLVDFGRAVESEREQLTFNLAALGNEKKKEFLGKLLGRSLDFLGSILGAALGGD